jgi:hypothetical protein
MQFNMVSWPRGLKFKIQPTQFLIKTFAAFVDRVPKVCHSLNVRGDVEIYCLSLPSLCTFGGLEFKTRLT